MLVCKRTGNKNEAMSYHSSTLIIALKCKSESAEPISSFGQTIHSFEYPNFHQRFPNTSIPLKKKYIHGFQQIEPYNTYRKPTTGLDYIDREREREMKKN